MNFRKQRTVCVKIKIAWCQIAVVSKTKVPKCQVCPLNIIKLKELAHPHYLKLLQLPDWQQKLKTGRYGKHLEHPVAPFGELRFIDIKKISR